ncbi:MAG: hypothetical protein SYR96_29335 [Actinomycetota bacterium]|nr:hypothetical protein [Actinomycetota bacterium]
MTGLLHGVLDPDDVGQLSEYERDFYRAYAGLSDNRLIRTIWDWDDRDRRLRTRIPYRSQIVYCQRTVSGRLAGAMAVSLAPEREFQAAAFGFSPPSQGGPRQARACEILNVMSGHAGPRWSVATYTAFIRGFGYGNLASKGFDVAYATCTRRRLRPYLTLGAELIDQVCIDGEERFFLRWSLHDTDGSQRQAPGPDNRGPLPESLSSVARTVNRSATTPRRTKPVTERRVRTLQAPRPAPPSA